jgi:hypothetical protein
MPERNAHTEVLRAGAAMPFGAVTLLPIERVVLDARRGDGCCWFAAVKEPYALVLRDAAGIRAVDVHAAAIPIEMLRVRVPRLDVVLAAM